ncbi:MAG: hypothetical protein WEA09_06990 [Gemmatimonadota bacterium]
MGLWLLFVPGSTWAQHRVGESPADVALDGGGAVRSLLLPGWDQYLERQGRWRIFAGVEALGLLAGGHQTWEARRFRDSYRNLAWEQARAGLAAKRLDGDFEYYEAMSSFASSGVFDRQPDVDALYPENDPATYNGALWRLSRQLFSLEEGVDPTHPTAAPALQHYRARAIQPEYEWDWGGDLQARERFSRWIERSDDARSRATLFMGLLLANHLLSGLDALVPGASDEPRVILGFDPAFRGAVVLRFKGWP